jgi:hypothetical protein
MPEAPVVCDTGPLVAFALIALLDDLISQGYSLSDRVVERATREAGAAGPPPRYLSPWSSSTQSKSRSLTPLPGAVATRAVTSRPRTSICGA